MCGWVKAYKTKMRGISMCLMLFFELNMMRGLITGKQIINLSTFLPKTGNWPVGKTIEPAAQLAADDINKNESLLPNHVINIIYHETGCNQDSIEVNSTFYLLQEIPSKGRALLELIRQFTSSQRIDGIIGDGCDVICNTFGLFASEFNLPMVSWGCNSIELSNKLQYSTFARTVGSRAEMLKPVGALFDQYNWNRFSIMAASEGTWEWFAQAINEVVEVARGGIIEDLHGFDAGLIGITEIKLENRKEVLEHMLEEIKILILCAGGGDMRQLMLSLLDLDKLNGDYVFIAMDLSSDAVYGANTWMGDDGRDADATIAFQGLLNVYMKKPDTEKYRAFEARVAEANSRAPFNNVMGENQEVDVHAGMLYDAVVLYAHALQDAIDIGYGVADLDVVSSFLYNRKFNGITGQVYIDQSGDRAPQYVVQVFSGDRFVDIADYSYELDALIMKEGVQVVFPGGRTDVPLDHPKCGWDNELCEDDSYITLITILGAVFGVVFVCVVGGLLMYRKLKFEAAVNSESLWRIRPTELLMGKEALKQSKASLLKSLRNVKTDGVSSHLSEAAIQVFAEVATYKSLSVCLTSIVEKTIVINRELLLALKQVRDLNHENINAFIGLCIDEPRRCIVMSYASRGSLQDVLENDQINLSANFKLSFILDICKGMEYLHNSPIGSHGRLKSSNCVVDNRWVCKITDYGLEMIRLTDKWSDEYRKYASLLWTAPELLRTKEPPTCGTKKGDVYSFGIILQEIATRDRPYSLIVDKEPKDIINMIEVALDPPYRPAVEKDLCAQYICDLMTRCWDEVAEARPTFTEIRRKLKEANVGKSMNILDNMIQMMEQYADNLEELVSERTKQLEEEKKKTDQLLYQMLPRSVADDLKLGLIMKPEAYESATVYFSDVVGFTHLASKSTPLQVVDFLNDLYSAFDWIIDSHDVYKVETIGDAYMVVSGVPEKNGIQHAGAAASMSLDILSCITTFQIKHMPGRQLQLRIGLHSGPVVAGVVGQKMPRYCLFGDTVNTASRMESSGYALHIHVSTSTKHILDELGGYTTKRRGEVDMKGKGTMVTYWLLSKEGFSKPLPDLSRAAAMSEHEFK